MLEEFFHVLERGGEIEAVADALVGVDGEVNVLALDEIALHVNFILPILAAEGAEDREVAEIIEVMDDRRNAKRAHGGKEDRAVERADLQQESGQQPEIVHHLENPAHENLSICLYDAAGRLCATTSTADAMTDITLPATQGVYLLRVSGENTHIVRKLTR